MPDLAIDGSTMAEVIQLAHLWADSENNESEEAQALHLILMSLYPISESVVRAALLYYKSWYLAEKPHWTFCMRSKTVSITLSGTHRPK